MVLIDCVDTFRLETRKGHEVDCNATKMSLHVGVPSCSYAKSLGLPEFELGEQVAGLLDRLRLSGCCDWEWDELQSTVFGCDPNASCCSPCGADASQSAACGIVPAALRLTSPSRLPSRKAVSPRQCTAWSAWGGSLERQSSTRYSPDSHLASLQSSRDSPSGPPLVPQGVNKDSRALRCRRIE